MSKTFVISQPIGGICLNGKEFVIGDDGKIQQFPTRAKAEHFLADNGVGYDDMERMGIQVESLNEVNSD